MIYIKVNKYTQYKYLDKEDQYYIYVDNLWCVYQNINIYYHRIYLTLFLIILSFTYPEKYVKYHNNKINQAVQWFSLSYRTKKILLFDKITFKNLPKNNLNFLKAKLLFIKLNNKLEPSNSV